MKISKNQLKRIIKEELERVEEDNSFKSFVLEGNKALGEAAQSVEVHKYDRYQGWMSSGRASVENIERGNSKPYYKSDHVL